MGFLKISFPKLKVFEMSLPAYTRISLSKWLPDSPRESVYSGTQSTSSGYGSAPLWSPSNYSPTQFTSTCPAVIQRNKRHVLQRPFSTTQKLIFGSQSQKSLPENFKKNKVSAPDKKKEEKIEKWTQMTPKNEKVEIRNGKMDA